MVLPGILAILLVAHPQDDTRPAEAVAEAMGLLDSGDTAVAVDRLEALARAFPESAAAHTSLGHAYSVVAREWQEAGSDPTLPLIDARVAYARALDLEPDRTEAQEAQLDTLVQLGDLPAALRLAEQAIGHAILARGSAPAWLLERAARASKLALFQAPPRDPDGLQREISRVRRVLERAQDMAPHSEALVLELADLDQWTGHLARAADRIARALAELPDAVALHQRLIDIHFFSDVSWRLPPLYRTLAAGHPLSATALWFRGYAALLEGDRARRETRFSEAREQYAACSRWLRESVEREASYAGSAARIAFLADLGTAWSAMAQRDHATATTGLMTLLDAAPELRTLPDGLGRTLLDAIGTLENELVEQREFHLGLDLARRVAAAVSDEASWYNNLGFLLREHATLVQGGAFGEEDAAPRARALFEESWAAYLRAAQLAPADARIVNDAALIQAYHLRTELPRAEAMFRQSIEAGQRQLDEMGAAPPEDERFPVAQAVGDAFQNLGFLAYHVHAHPARALEEFRRSMETNSGSRPEVERWIDALEGRAEIPEDPFHHPAPMQRPVHLEPRAFVPWEPSFREGLAVAARENRPLVVYYRGHGQGDLVPALDDFVASARFLRATSGCARVVADALNYNFRERDERGHRIASLRHGTISSRDHIQAHEEFTAWWSEHRSASAPVVPEERLYYFRPDGTIFEPERWADLTSAVETLTGDAGPRNSDASAEEQRVLQLRSFRQPDARMAARALLEQPGRAARERFEALLFDAQQPDTARAALVEALARRPEESYRELLSALIRQRHDADLATLTLRAVPEQADVADLKAAYLWSPHASVREAAEVALASHRDQDDVQKLLLDRSR